MWKDNPACGPHKFVEVPDSELAFYWPGKCDRCHLTASTSTEAMACCKGENAAWDCISKSQSRSHNASENVECGGWTASNTRTPKGIDAIRVANHQCSRYPNVNGTDGGKHYPMRLRKHLRYRLDGLAPNRGSALDRFVDLVGSRKVYFLGDSVLKQFVEYLEVRAFDLDAAKLSRHPSLYLSIRNLVQFNDCYNHQPKCNIPVRGKAGDIVISSFGNHFDPTAGLTFNRNKRMLTCEPPLSLTPLECCWQQQRSKRGHPSRCLGPALPVAHRRVSLRLSEDRQAELRGLVPLNAEAAWFDEVADLRAPYQTGLPVHATDGPGLLLRREQRHAVALRAYLRRDPRAPFPERDLAVVQRAHAGALRRALRGARLHALVLHARSHRGSSWPRQRSYKLEL